MNGLDIITIFEHLYPKSLAYSWDNVGLQIGTLDKKVNSILLTLDLNLEVANEAVSKGVELIIVHHPLIFSPLKSIHTDTPQGEIIELLIKNDVTVYVAHTNFDVSNYGMNMILANMLKLENQDVLEFVTETEGLGRKGFVKEIAMRDFITFVKQTFHLDSVRFIGDINSNVKQVAITGGSGSSSIQSAKESQVDVLITGDISYHHAQDIIALGFNAIDVGHNIEKYFMKELKKILENKGISSNIILSQVDTNPYQNV
ncbi:MAG: Nif3-like dinuclear metal center hexameric protein [Bacilli bacterium]|nr:Nif3-like dinuclear metal center hexameric protein [Bacilli bacterium]